MKKRNKYREEIKEIKLYSLCIMALIAVILAILSFSVVHIEGSIDLDGVLDLNDNGVPLELRNVDVSFEVDIPLLLVVAYLGEFNNPTNYLTFTGSD